MGGVLWTLTARWILRLAQRSKHYKMRGPGTQALAMATLFFPVILVAVVVPGMLELSYVWSSASLTNVGVLLSAVIADPLRRFLLGWGNLCRTHATVPGIRKAMMGYVERKAGRFIPPGHCQISLLDKRSTTHRGLHSPPSPYRRWFLCGPGPRRDARPWTGTWTR